MLTLGDLGSITSRVVAIFLFTGALTTFSEIYTYATVIEESSVRRLLLWSPAIAKLALSFIFWLAPFSVASLLIPSTIRNKEVGSVDFHQLEAAALGIIGLCLVVWGISDILYHIYILTTSGELTRGEFVLDVQANFFATIFELIIGTWLVLRRDVLGRILNKLR